MELHITREQAKDEKFLRAQQQLANVLGAELVIDYPIIKPKRFDCTIWMDENNDVASGEFDTKREAIDWTKKQLAKHPTAIADLKRWNAKGDDFEDWQYRMVDGKFAEVDGFGY